MTITEAKEAVGMTSGDLWKWALGIVAAVMMALITMMTSDGRARVDRLEQRVQSTEQKTIELNAYSADMTRRLGRIEDKLDRVLETR